jgi:hypothetical protein
MEFAECPPRHPFRPLDARSAPRQLRKKRGTRSNGARPTPASWWICSHGTVAPTIAAVCRAIINSSQYLLSSLPRLHDFTPMVVSECLNSSSIACLTSSWIGRLHRINGAKFQQIVPKSQRTPLAEQPDDQNVVLSGNFGLAKRAATILTFLYVGSAVTSSPIQSGSVNFWSASVSSISAKTTPSKSPS